MDTLLFFKRACAPDGGKTIKLSDLFDDEDKLADVNSYDASLMEKVKLVEELNEEEKKIVFSLVDALVGKKKLKDALTNVLTDVK